MGFERKGNKIFFGNYYYERGKKEPIEWEILEEKNGYAMIVTRYIIDCKPFFSGSNNYAESSIRKWLNSTFYNEAFTSLEKARIKMTNVDNGLESAGLISCDYICKNTFDYIFLLSYKEAVPLGIESVMPRYTHYARDQGLHAYYGRAAWWLRSPVNFYYPLKVRAIEYDGTFCDKIVGEGGIGVRPACWVRL